jgi:hypothetical protein
MAAATAGTSVCSARRIDNNAQQPKAGQPRGRTRPDPLEQVWQSLLVPLLQREPALMPITLLEHLQQQKPDVDWFRYQRTLQRHVRDCKAFHSPAPEVMFPLSYEPGEIAFCDFTQLKGVTETAALRPTSPAATAPCVAITAWPTAATIVASPMRTAVLKALTVT